ncbi:MAG: hypothetical protein WED04_13495 [Promethearchaeati archaeon SRVP18_Atabeyarchaeia-1]
MVPGISELSSVALILAALGVLVYLSSKLIIFILHLPLSRSVKVDKKEELLQLLLLGELLESERIESIPKSRDSTEEDEHSSERSD